MKGEWYAVIALGLLAVGLIPLALSVLIRIACRHHNQIDRITRADLLEALGLLLLAGGTFILTFLGVARGQFWILEAPMKLAIGWAQYLDRIEKDVRPDFTHVASGVVCLVAFAVGAHLFLRWLARSVACEWPAKRTFQALVLVGLMFASGLAVVGLVQQTGWLIRTPEPLVKDNRSIS